MYAPAGARAAYGAYRAARTYGPAAMKAAKIIRRSYRSYRKNKRQKLSHPSARVSEPAVTTSNISYRDFQLGTATAPQVMTRKTLYSGVINPCNPPTDNDNLRNAPALSYFLSGIKLCAWWNMFSNQGAQVNRVHYAIVQLKAYNESATTANLKTEMLSDHKNATDRYVDFVDGGVPDYLQDCASLNPRKFNILMHRKFLLSQGSAGTYPGHMMIDKWIPINKRFEYESSTSLTAVKPLVFMTWFENVDGSAPSNVIQGVVNTVGFVRKEE